MLRAVRLIFSLTASVALFSAGEANVIKPADAQAMIKAYTSAQQATQAMAMAPRVGAEPVGDVPAPMVSDMRSVTYPVAAIQLLMSQPGMSTPGAKVRIYKALNRLQQETFVLVGVDAAGVEIMGTSAIVIDNGEPCPPFCGGGAP